MPSSFSSASPKRARLPAASRRRSGRSAAAETVTIAPEGLAEWQQLYRVLQGYEAWAAHGPWITSRNAELGPQTATRFEVSRRVTAAEADAATRKRGEVRERVRGLVGDDGVLMLPTMPGIALLVDAPEPEFEAFRARAISMLCIAGPCRPAAGLAAGRHGIGLPARALADRPAGTRPGAPGARPERARRLASALPCRRPAASIPPHSPDVWRLSGDLSMKSPKQLFWRHSCLRSRRRVAKRIRMSSSMPRRRSSSIRAGACRRSATSGSSTRPSPNSPSRASTPTMTASSATPS